MRQLKKLLFVLFVMYIPLQSVAWGTQGHRICGQIASTYLTPKARAAVEAILGNETIALASNWADYIRPNPQYGYLLSWHYVDFAKVYTYPQMVNFLNHDTATDAYTKIEFMINELKKKNLSKENKLLYLRMLIHVVEDIHQPMHTAHAEDKGGNNFKVYWFSKPTNLHAIWDSELIDFQQLSYTEYATAINHTTLAERTRWQKEPVSKWIFESNQIAEKLYTEIKPGSTLNYKYDYQHIDQLNLQMLKAGVRLAGLLNQLFG